jgi:fluoride exporter
VNRSAQWPPGRRTGGARRVVIPVMIAVGALIGAPARYLASRAIQSWHETAFPWGMLAVNVVASLALGGLTGRQPQLSPVVTGLVGAGFCGSLSTYTTFSYETMRLSQNGAHRYAAANLLLSLVLGIGAAGLGWWLVRVLA